MTREKLVNLLKQLDKERSNSRKRKQADKRKPRQRREIDREPTVEEWDPGDDMYWLGKDW